MSWNSQPSYTVNKEKKTIKRGNLCMAWILCSHLVLIISKICELREGVIYYVHIRKVQGRPFNTKYIVHMGRLAWKQRNDQSYDACAGKVEGKTLHKNISHLGRYLVFGWTQKCMNKDLVVHLPNYCKAVQGTCSGLSYWIFILTSLMGCKVLPPQSTPKRRKRHIMALTIVIPL